jgi:parallel beta-helix repeat protein
MRRLLVTVLAAGLFCWSAEPASATHVSCGDVITKSVKLDSDLVNCPGDGLVVGADDITIDLGGHTISGGPGGGAGINDHFQHDRIVVENGTITGFFDNVLLEQSNDSVLRRLSLSSLYNGLHLVDSSQNTIEKNSLSGMSRGRAIMLEGESDRNRVEKNSTSGANVSISLEATGSSSLKIPDNNLVQKNDVRSSGFGIFLARAILDRVEKNTLVDNVFSVFVEASYLNAIERNDVLRGGIGIQLMQSNDNRLSGNRVQEELSSGIYVFRDSPRTIVEGNTTNHNADDGIHVDAPSTTLTGNVANDNGDLGIEAVPGVTDGGGNRAKGNGNPAQCVNVACG